MKLFSVIFQARIVVYLSCLAGVLCGNKAFAWVDFVAPKVSNIVLQGNVYTAIEHTIYKDGQVMQQFPTSIFIEDMATNGNDIFVLATQTKIKNNQAEAYFYLYKNKKEEYKVKTTYETIEKAYLQLQKDTCFVCISGYNQGTTFYKNNTIWQELSEYESPTSFQMINNNAYWVGRYESIPKLLKNKELAFNRAFTSYEDGNIQFLVHQNNYYYTALNSESFPELYENDNKLYNLPTHKGNVACKGIAFINGSFYVYGHCGSNQTEKNRACYWKDGTLVEMSKDDVHSDVTQVFSNQEDIYVSVLEDVDNYKKMVCKIYKNNHLLYTLPLLQPNNKL